MPHTTSRSPIRFIAITLALAVIVSCGDHPTGTETPSDTAVPGLVIAGLGDCVSQYLAPQTWYAKSGANAARATGAKNRPFASLADAEAASAPGDVIVVLHAPANRAALDGGITLKDCQKLLGTGPSVTTAPSSAARSKITNGQGDAVTLADYNEVAGLHIEDAGGYAVIGRNTTGGYIHDNLFTGWNQLEQLEDFPPFAFRRAGRGAVTFLTDEGATTENEVQDNVFRDATSTAIATFATDDAEATARSHGNTIREIDGSSFLGGGRNHGVFAASFDGATVNLTVTSTVVDNIENVSDGISTFACSTGLPGTCFRAGTAPGGIVNLVVREFVYLNTGGLGNNGIETLTAPGSRTTFLLERSDIIGAFGFGIVLFNAGGNPGSDIIDLGGGALGSIGQNRILDTGSQFGPANAALALLNGDMVAENNWWGVPEGLKLDCPVVPSTPPGVACAFLVGNSSLDFEPFLTEDPRP